MYNLFKYLEETEGKVIPLNIRIKYNIEFYYKDKSLIKDEAVLEILDKAYSYWKDLLGTDLNKLNTFSVDNYYYDVVYGKSKDEILLAYDKKNNENDIHYYNVYLKLKSHMKGYVTDHEILIPIIHGYLVNTLQMKGSHTENQIYN